MPRGLIILGLTVAAWVLFALTALSLWGWWQTLFG